MDKLQSPLAKLMNEERICNTTKYSKDPFTSIYEKNSLAFYGELLLPDFGSWLILILGTYMYVGIDT